MARNADCEGVLMGNPFLDTIDRLRNEREWLREELGGLQDAIKKYADERKVLIAENDRLKKELAAATFNELPF